MAINRPSDAHKPRPKAGADAESSPAQKTKRREKRWGRRALYFVLALVILVVVLVGAAPYVASTQPAVSWILANVNDRVSGDVQVRAVSLSWFGDCRVRDVVVKDPDGRDVLSVAGVTFADGIWGALWASREFDRLHIESPRAVLYVAEDGSTSLAHALSGKGKKAETPLEPRDDAGFSLPQGHIEVSDASVRIVKADGQSFDVPDVGAVVRLGEGGNVTASLHLTLASGGRLAGDVELRDTVVDGKFLPPSASGKVRLVTEEDIQLGPIGDFMLADSTTGGALGLNLDASIESGRLASVFKASFTEVTAYRDGASRPQPLNLTIDGRVDGDRQLLEGSLQSQGDAGQMETAFAFSPAEFDTATPPGELIAGLFNGESVALPGFKLDAAGSLDLPTVAAAVPSLLSVRPGTEITEGKLTVSDLKIRGGQEASATASMQLTSVAGRRDGQAIRMEPVSMDMDVRLEGGAGLRVERAELSSDFARLSASGTASQLDATVSGDLSMLRRQLAEFVDLGETELAGTFSGDLKLARAADDRVDVQLNLNASQLRYGDAGATMTLPQAALRHAGSIALPPDRGPKLLIEETTIDLEGRVNAVASGWYDTEDQSFEADVRVGQADIGYLAERAAEFGVGSLRGFAGTLQAKTRISRPSSGAPLDSNGDVTLRNAQLDGEELTPNVALAWSDVRYEPEKGTITVPEMKLESDLATVTAQAVDCDFGGEFTIAGRVKANADLARTMPVLARFGGMEKPPAIGGKLAVDSSFRSSGTGQTFGGTAAIDPFTVSLEDGSEFKDSVQFTYDGDWSPPEQRISLRKANLTSGFLSTRVKGHIDEYTSLCTLALDGDYELDWGRLMTVLHQLVPSTVGTFDITGRAAGPVTAKGPACPKGVQPPFYNVVASTRTTWDSAEVYGLAMGPAEVAPVLRNGVLQIPKTEVRTAEGWVRFGGTVDFTKAPPELVLVRELVAMEEVQITQALAEHFLGRINPVFSHAASIKGGLSLLVKNLDMPLGPAALERGSGSGTLNLESITMKPSGLLTELLALGGLQTGEPRTVKLGRVDFRVDNGRIVYDELAMVFGEDYDIRFHGSVGLDDTLDLIVSLPVRPNTLERMGITGKSEEYIRSATGQRLEIPLTGTRQKPKLDFSKMNIGEMIIEAGKKGLIEGLKDAIPDPRRGDEGDADRRDIPEDRRKREPAQDGRRVIPDDRRKREPDEDRKRDVPEERRKREPVDERGVRDPRALPDKRDIPDNDIRDERGVREPRKAVDKRDIRDKEVSDERGVRAPRQKEEGLDKRDARKVPDASDKRDVREKRDVPDNAETRDSKGVRDKREPPKKRVVGDKRDKAAEKEKAEKEQKDEPDQQNKNENDNQGDEDD